MMTPASFHHYPDSHLNQQDAENGYDRINSLNTLMAEILKDEALTKIAIEKALIILTDLESIDVIAPTVRRVVQRHAPWMLTEEE